MIIFYLSLSLSPSLNALARSWLAVARKSEALREEKIVCLKKLREVCLQKKCEKRKKFMYEKAKRCEKKIRLEDVCTKYTKSRRRRGRGKKSFHYINNCV
jgi:hypothetical protein